MPADLITVRDVVDRYLAHCAVVGRHSPEAAAERERTLRGGAKKAYPGFVEAVGDVALCDCSPAMLEDWIEGNPAWRSTSTRKAKANQVAAAFNWAAKRQSIARNPFAGVRYDEADPRPCLPDDVLDQLRTRANKPFERVLDFLRATGCRLSDLFRLRWEHVDLDKGLARLPFRKGKRRGCQKPKPLYLLPEAVELLRKMRLESNEGEVFRNTQGRPWTRRTLGQQVNRLKRRLGIYCKASLHGIRHTVGTTAVKNGTPIKFVSRLLGHSSSAITERFYVHDEDDVDSMRQAAEAARPKVRA